MKRGYVIIAHGPPRYYRQAEVAAKSALMMDDEADVLIYADGPFAGRLKEMDGLFDRVKVRKMTGRPSRLEGNAKQLCLWELSPFNETIYIDSDVIKAKRKDALGISIWSRLEGMGVGIAGQIIGPGAKWRIPVEPVLEKFEISGICQNNGGVIYFDRSPKSETFFNRALQLHDARIPEISIQHVTGGGLANEPFWAVAAMQAGVEPLATSTGFNISTRNMAGWSIDRKSVV